MNKIIYCIPILITIILLSVPTVFALSTTITIKTKPFHDVFVQVAHPEYNTVLSSYSNKSDLEGNIQFEFTSTAELNKLNFYVVTRLFGEIVNTTWYYDQPVSSNMEIGFPDEAEVQVQEEQEVTESGSGAEELTGLAVSEPAKSSGKLSGKVYYIAGAFLFVALMLMVVQFMVLRKKGILPKVAKTTTSHSSSSTRELDRELEEAQRKIRRVQAEIKTMRAKRPALSRAEEEFRRARERLERERLREREKARESHGRNDRFKRFGF